LIGLTLRAFILSIPAYVCFFFVQFVFGNGSGGESIFNGKKFKDERAGLVLKHDRRGLLSMGNSGKNSNSSQWFITFQAAPQCDGKHVIFGSVVSGWQVLDALELVGSADGIPSCSIVVTDCGIWVPFETPACGYWYDQPDAESYTGVSSVFMVRPRVAVLAPNAAAVLKFAQLLAAGGCVVTHQIVTEDSPDDTTQVDRVEDILGRHEVDVVVVAPACQQIRGLVRLPETWATMRLDQIVLTAKPQDALEEIRTKSWLVKKQTPWQIDGQIR
jgi:cyclophilin family peptidyl-prolyl cis-trans isomerase